jgi:hypothetical protein
MTRPTSVSHFLATPADQAKRAETRHQLSDAERMARGRAQIALGDYIEDDQVDAFLDSLQIPASKV